jgi:Trk K+ transport system NAD-binding subunit
MKFLVSQLLYFLRDRPSRINLFALLRFLAILLGMVTLYSVAFHYLMAYEGRQESWLTGFYWTLTVMSTLGFGDITFHSDLGRFFSIVVLLSGIIFLLVLLPFTFIEFFYAPWMKAQEAARTPTQLPPKSAGHVIIIQLDDVTETLIERLNQYHYPYVLLAPDLPEALRLDALGYRVVRGALDDPETYRRVRADQAALAVATANDRVNSNVAFTVREVSEQIPIITTANHAASVDILELAGSNHVLQLGEMLGQTLARRLSGGEKAAHIIGRFGELVIAEAMVRNAAFVGKSLRASRLREQTGVSVLGAWIRGKFELADPEMLIDAGTALVMAGTAQQLARYNQLYCSAELPDRPVLIIGGGRVGRATANALAAQGMDYRIVELLPERIRDPEKYVLGDAADLAVLERAGIRETAAVLVTTHDDDTNIYLTIYCRRLRPNVQLISRARLERNVATLHRAGADFVLSYASMGANAIFNLLNRSNILMVAEGLDVFEVAVPARLAGRTIAESEIRTKTGCTVIALRDGDQMLVSPAPDQPFPRDGKIILIGTVAAEQDFLTLFAA